MLIRFIIILLLVYLLYKVVKSFCRSKSAGIDNRQFNTERTMPTVGEDLVEDPNCHTYVPVSQAYKKEVAGKNYYFCSKECCESYISEKSN